MEGWGYEASHGTLKTEVTACHHPSININNMVCGNQVISKEVTMPSFYAQSTRMVISGLSNKKKSHFVYITLPPAESSNYQYFFQGKVSGYFQKVQTISTFSKEK